MNHKGEGRARVIDLQGKLPLRGLIAVIANAEYFIGIDSMPAHVAQAAGVRCAVFYGAVNPLARTWDEASVWPLTAELECLECYHKHLESSAPFCMRFDEACTIGPDSENTEQMLRAMVSGERYCWSGHRRRLEALQSKWFGFMRHHPSPPERLMRPAANGNELVSNLIHRVLDQAAELAARRYRTNSIIELTERLRDSEARAFTREIELDALRRAARRGSNGQGAAPVTPEQGARTVELTDLTLTQRRCTVAATAHWLDVTGLGIDPQLLLPVIRGLGGPVRLRLASIASHADALQVFWVNDEEAFSDDQQRSIPVGPEANRTDLAFDLAEGQKLRLRIDPIRGIGRMRLYGTLSGNFDIEGYRKPVTRQTPEGKQRRRPDPKVVKGSHIRRANGRSSRAMN
jgi:hypothetical protein